MPRGTLSRRGFLNRATAALMAAALPAWCARETAATMMRRPSAARNRIVVAAIGVGLRGSIVMEEAARAGARIAAVCDVDAGHRAAARRVLSKIGQKDVEEFNDFREILDREEIAAVTVATPDHWHALIASEAMKRGKDVYCEKPVSLTVSEGRAVVQAARKYGRIFQTGSQQRSDARFRLACELVRNGRLGKIRTVEARIGENPVGGPFPTEKVPPGLDWDLWLGPAPEVDYVRRRCHYDFRWWYEYAGGKVTDWGAHHLDIAQWGLGTDATGPVAIRSECEKPAPAEPNCFNCPPRFTITYKYAPNAARYVDGTQVVCTDGGENGVKFVGEDDAWIFVSRGTITASDRKLLDEPLPSDAVRLAMSDHHMRNFLESIASREGPICNAAIGHRSATICHLGNISMRLGGRTLRWMPDRERFLGNASADEMLARSMRGPWKLEH